MRNKRFSRLRKQVSGTKTVAWLLPAAALLLWAPSATAGAPEWLRALARAPVPRYAEETDAVVLLDERVTTVNESGEIKTLYRRAYKILRPEGRKRGTVVVYFDNETRLTYLKAWSLPAAGGEYEVKEKDAIETSPFGVELYADTRRKVLPIPAAEPGNVIGYEYEQKRRPFILQDRWFFQDPDPVRRARFALQLPKGWEFVSVWMNYSAQDPHRTGENQWVWEIADVPAIEPELSMPPWQAVGGWLAVTYYPRHVEEVKGKGHGSWHDVGAWYSQLAATRRQATPEIQRKVAELTSSAPMLLDKIRALASFAQRKIRYVAIEIGIGGYQPHLAQDVFSNGYGDCKDKATLLSTMLREVGIESYYVLIHTSRGVVARNFPSMLNFNHAILAIRLPEEVPATSLYSVRNYEQLGRLLFFDPTDSFTPLGYLPPTLQANYGLLVTQDGGELLELPLLPPSVNRLLRVAKLALSPTGTLSGEVQEIRWGAPAVNRRAELLEATGPERSKILERFLGRFLGGFVLVSAEAENLEDFDKGLVVRYRFVAESYAKAAGNLLLVRPRVLGQKSADLLERK